MWVTKRVALSVAALLFLSQILISQTPISPHSSPEVDPMKGPEAADPNYPGPRHSQPGEEMRREAEEKANEKRQAELRSDADKLLLLSTELKHSVDKTNENILSTEVIKKAAEIEKLAHSIRQKMRGNYNRLAWWDQQICFGKLILSNLVVTWFSARVEFWRTSFPRVDC